jgi:selenocysteine lyase/cysteine desulfurase
VNSSEPQRIYLDNAATSFPKPDSVVAAVTQYMTQCGVAAGRGTSRQATELDARIAACRARLARLLGAASPQEISFAFNGTDSLNLAIHGCLAPGDHVVTTELEHNSVLRPLRDWETHRGVQVTHLAPGADGRIDPASVRDALRPNTRLVAVTHASNVTGVIQPIRDIGELIARARTLTLGPSPGGKGQPATRGVLYLVDAAQTAGHVPIDVQAGHIDLLCCSGHKGLLGPLGSGVTYIRKHPRSARCGREEPVARASLSISPLVHRTSTSPATPTPWDLSDWQQLSSGSKLKASQRCSLALSRC